MDDSRYLIDSAPLNLVREQQLFRGLSEGHMRSVFAHMFQHEFPAGESIISEGSRGESLFLIADGRVGVWKRQNSSGEVYEEKLCELGAGEIFGEMALLENERRSATVRTLQPSVLLSLSREHLENFNTMDPEIYVCILRNLASIVSRRLRTLDSKYVNLFPLSCPISEPQSAER
ncbi:MAG: cyclic nucleotide-binding domain-containing protein [Verrucomicrobiota bacterium]